MNKTKLLSIGVLVSVLAAGAFVVAPVLAHDGVDHPNDRAATAHERATGAQQEAQDRVQQLRQEVSQKLTDAKKRACEQREQAINNIIQRSSTQATRHVEVFQTIQERVMQFKEDNNLTPENYDALVQAADDARLTAVETAEAAEVTTFECDDEGTGRQFSSLIRETVKNQQDALKDYRSALVDLIRAVKQSAGSESEEG